MRKKIIILIGILALLGIINEIQKVYYLNNPHKDSKEKGISKDYYENGNLKIEGFYKNDKLEWSKKYAGNGTLIKEQFKEKGISKDYYENGNLKAEAPFKGGKREGISKHYYEDGNLQVEAPFKNGKLEGIWKHYHKNGNLKVEGLYKNDKLEGLKKYNEDGNLIMERFR